MKKKRNRKRNKDKEKERNKMNKRGKTFDLQEQTE